MKGKTRKIASAIIVLFYASFLSITAFAASVPADSLKAYSLDAALVQAKTRISRNYFQPVTTYDRYMCSIKPKCIGDYFSPFLVIENGDKVKTVEVWSLIEQGIRQQANRLYAGSSESDNLYQDVYRLAWIQYMLYQPFSNRNPDNHENTIAPSQVKQLSEFIMLLSTSLFTMKASDDDVLIARNRISRILNADIASQLAGATIDTGPYGFYLTSSLLAKIRRAVCPLWPVCDQ